MKFIKILFAIVIVAVIGLALWLPGIDSYQKSGQLSLSALQKPVTIHRDDYGIPYIYAESLDDAITAQGFVVAQHRLFQLELFRQMAQGRLAELIGEKGLSNDRLIRVVNISGLADRQIELLGDEERNFFQRYLNGVNAYITEHSDEHPLILKLMIRTPKPWNLKDIVALQYFQVWSSSVNWRQELMNQQLLDALGA